MSKPTNKPKAAGLAAFVLQHLQGAWQLLRFQPKAFGFFDTSMLGARFSFLAAVVALPLYVILVLSDEAPATVDAARFISVQAISYIAQWALMPLLLYYVCVALQQAPRWPQLVVPYNWLTVWQLAIYVLLLQLFGSGVASQAVTLPIIIAAGFYLMGVQAWLYNRVLQRGPWVALLIVGLNLLVDWQLGLARFALLQVAP